MKKEKQKNEKDVGGDSDPFQGDADKIGDLDNPPKPLDGKPVFVEGVIEEKPEPQKPKTGDEPNKQEKTKEFTPEEIEKIKKHKDDLIERIQKNIRENEQEVMALEIEVKSFQRDIDEEEVKIDSNRKHAAPISAELKKAQKNIEDSKIKVENYSRLLTSLDEEKRPWEEHRNSLKKEQIERANRISLLKKQIDRLGVDLSREATNPSLPGMSPAEENLNDKEDMEDMEDMEEVN